MHIEVTSDDIALAGGYFDSNNCLVATALKRLFPTARTIEVYPNMFQIDGEFYEFESRTARTIRHFGNLIFRGNRDAVKSFYFQAHRMS